MTACRQNLAPYWAKLLSGGASHAGLVLSKCLLEHNDDSASKHKVIAAAIAASRNSSQVYASAYRRRADWFARRENNGKWHVKKIPLDTCIGSRVAVGLGGMTPVEIGVALHPVYGTPLIPGSSVKGLARAFAIELSQFKDDELSLLFGTTEGAGYLAFHDAWMHPESLLGEQRGLHADVMTTHHSRYYSSSEDKFVPPTDFDEPIPVPFVSVTGRFCFIITCDDVADPNRSWLGLAADLLIASLKNWGIGGKTSSGYGRFVEPPETPSHRKD